MSDIVDLDADDTVDQVVEAAPVTEAAPAEPAPQAAPAEPVRPPLSAFGKEALEAIKRLAGENGAAVTVMSVAEAVRKNIYMVHKGIEKLTRDGYITSTPLVNDDIGAVNVSVVEGIVPTDPKEKKERTVTSTYREPTEPLKGVALRRKYLFLKDLEKGTGQKREIVNTLKRLCEQNENKPVTGEVLFAELAKTLVTRQGPQKVFIFYLKDLKIEGILQEFDAE